MRPFGSIRDTCPDNGRSPEKVVVARADRACGVLPESKKTRQLHEDDDGKRVSISHAHDDKAEFVSDMRDDDVKIVVPIDCVSLLERGFRRLKSRRLSTKAGFRVDQSIV